MYNVILGFLTAFMLTYFAIPSIIHIARVKNLCDEPGERRSHTVTTPSLGGIGIFAGLIFSIVLWTPFNLFNDLQYIICALIIIFLIGARDDIVPMKPMHKLAGQFVAALILVYKSNVKITSMYGVLGIQELPEWVAISLSIFTILVIVNAFNLIDGINGLSGSIGVLICVFFGIWFFLIRRTELSIVAFCAAGAIMAFLKYNYTPAEIFMGDTGSLLVGLIAAILAIKFIESHEGLLSRKYGRYAFDSHPIVAIGIIIIPLFDTLRVFITRAIKGRSPFSPDRTHIHHMLIDSGLSHLQATAVLVMVNIGFIIMVTLLQSIGSLNLLAIILLVASTLTGGLHYHLYYVQPKKLSFQK